jgi:hypothetical protein
MRRVAPCDFRGDVDGSRPSALPAYHGALFDFVRHDEFDAVPYSFSTSTGEVAVQVERPTAS